MASKKNIPEIRFKGFDGEWEEKELDSIALFSKGHGYSKNDLVKNGTPIILYGRLYTQYQTVITEVDTYVTAKKNSVYSKGNEVVIPASGETAEDISRAAAVIHPAILIGSDLNIITPSKELKSIFLALSVSNGRPQREISKRAQGKSIVHLHNSDFRDVSIIYPTTKEQSQIGTFFQNLDALITQRQKKLEKLSSLKKAMLEKMFPRDGADEPELRFKGFTGKWERRKLGELYKERNERGNSSLPILSVSIHDGVSHGELDSDTLGKQVRRSEDKSLYKLVITGDLVFNMMRAWQGAVGVVQTKGMVSPAYITAIPGEDLFPAFMEFYLRRDSIISQMDNLSYGVTDFRKRLYWDSFIRISCSIPSIPEQTKIASYFQHLDSLFSLQKRELDKLKNMKKACLQKMFV